MATPEENPDLTAHLEELAQSFIDSGTEKFGLTLDYSEDSLAYMDEVISKFLSDGEPSEETLFEHGAYAGETLRRKFGGVWVQDEQGVALLKGIAGRDLQASPFSWVQARFTNGMADALAARFAKFQEEVQQAGGTAATSSPSTTPEPTTASAPSEDELIKGKE